MFFMLFMLSLFSAIAAIFMLLAMLTIPMILMLVVLMGDACTCGGNESKCSENDYDVGDGIQDSFWVGTWVQPDFWPYFVALCGGQTQTRDYTLQARINFLPEQNSHNWGQLSGLENLDSAGPVVGGPPKPPSHLHHSSHVMSIWSHGDLGCLTTYY